MHLTRSLVFLAALTLTAVLTLPATGPLAPRAASAAALDESEPLDRVVLRNGRVVEGRILSENDREIEILVMVAGISAPTTFPRSEVLEIQRAVVERPAAAPATRSDRRPADRQPRPTAGSKKIYHLPMKGHLMGAPFGGIPYLYEASRRDVLSHTSINNALRDAVSTNPDVIIIEVDADSPGGFDGLWVTEGLAPLFEEIQREGHRIVFWVRRAGAGAAFLPMLSREIYFKPDGLLGGIGSLAADMGGGDKVVIEKQISLRIGHAEGIAIQNGYHPALVRAMARKENWLAVRFRGGEPEYIEHEPREQDGPDWVILSDDGEGPNKDTSPFEGNDVLNLDARWAQTLGVSKGTADTMDDLAFQLGFRDDYTVETGRGQRMLDDWQTRVARAVDELYRLNEQIHEGQSRAGDARAEIGRRIRLYEQMRSIMTVYAEVLDPDGSYRAQFDVEIEALRTQARGAGQRPGQRPGGGGPAR